MRSALAIAVCAGTAAACATAAPPPPRAVLDYSRQDCAVRPDARAPFPTEPADQHDQRLTAR